MTIESPLLPTVILLGSGIAGLIISSYLRTSPIIGFLLIGILIGPDALGLLQSNSTTIHFLGEIGICFLLFDVGLHLSIKEFQKNWKKFFSLGVAQVGICIMTFASVMIYFNIYPVHTAIILAATFALSSSALVFKLLADENDEHSPSGKIATNVLVFQDLIAILLMVLLSNNTQAPLSATTFLIPILKMLGCAVAIVIFAKIALKPLFKLLIKVKSEEVFTATALLIVFLTSYITESLGLSLALGAFLGGLALSESSYAYIVRTEVSPFRSLLLALFFLSLGINFDIDVARKHFFILASVLCGFIALKIFANYLALRVLRVAKENSTLLAPLLAQGSEFAFVVIAVLSHQSLVTSDEASFLSALVGLSLIVSPFFTMIGCKLSRSMCRLKHEEDTSHSGEEKDVIIVGIDEYGRQLATLLDMEGIPYRAHDFDYERLSYAQSRGFNVFYSDANRPRTLGRVGLGKALAIVSFLEEDSVLETLIHGLFKMNATVPLFAATEDYSRLENIISLGVKDTYDKKDSSLIALYETLLNKLGFLDADIKIKVAKAKEYIYSDDLFPRNVAGIVEEFQNIEEYQPLAA